MADEVMKYSILLISKMRDYGKGSKLNALQV